MPECYGNSIIIIGAPAIFCSMTYNRNTQNIFAETGLHFSIHTHLYRDLSPLQHPGTSQNIFTETCLHWQLQINRVACFGGNRKTKTGISKACDIKTKEWLNCLCDILWWNLLQNYMKTRQFTFQGSSDFWTIPAFYQQVFPSPDILLAELTPTNYYVGWAALIRLYCKTEVKCNKAILFLSQKHTEQSIENTDAFSSLIWRSRTKLVRQSKTEVQRKASV